MSLCSLTYDSRLVGGSQIADLTRDNIPALRPTHTMRWPCTPVRGLTLAGKDGSRSAVSICAEPRREQLLWRDRETATRIHSSSLRREIQEETICCWRLCDTTQFLEFSSLVSKKSCFQLEGSAADGGEPQSIDCSVEVCVTLTRKSPCIYNGAPGWRKHIDEEALPRNTSKSIHLWIVVEVWMTMLSQPQ